MALWKRKPDEVVKVLVDMDQIEGLLQQIDSATNRLEAAVDKAAITLRALERGKGQADVAAREALQAAEVARQAAKRTTGGRKW